MPEEPDNAATPRRHRPILSDLSKETLEDDLWNLDDEERDDAPSAVEVEPRRAPTGEKFSPAAPPASSTDPKPSKPKPKAPEAAAPRPKIERKATALRPHQDELALDDEDPDDAAPPVDAVEEVSSEPPATLSAPAPAPSLETPPKEPEAQRTPASRSQSAKIEMLGLGALAAILLGLGIWWLSGLFSSVRTTGLGGDLPDLPAKGEFVRIEKIDTYWRKPIREGDHADRATSSALYIPVLSVTLDDDRSGALRVLFKDADGNFVGDPISHSISAGKFTGSGSETAEFAATDGFHQIAAFNGYRVDDDRWTAEVYEASSLNASGSDFKKLLVTPLFPKHD
ncbi:hypothetical protein HNR46_002003 [Haloferula luteola]|uniref:Uncharacterized protein n=1 Tax=Haloferula luteola TaxID=595692 RepID=A0A840V849_9BACT|nr:hypothetical protein [Haloferula luteola]MBB5351764.1 hypothetical protein [Haloferula luteola]